jgi:hypothetical protein
MRTEGKLSKVAICERCNGWVLACHVDYLDKETMKEFGKLASEGFAIKTETIPETKARPFSGYQKCKDGLCKPRTD